MTRPLAPVDLPLWDASGAQLVEDVTSLVDSPSLTAASRDGFALRARDIADAAESSPVVLPVIDTVVAGSAAATPVSPGTAVRVMTGAPMPAGADAVIAVEFVEELGESIRVAQGLHPGRNVLERGTDVARGQLIAEAGAILTPAMTGLMAAGGHHKVRVRPRPRVAVVATGDEIVTPGRGNKLLPGQLYASNLITLRSWLQRFGMESQAAVAPDDPAAMAEVVARELEEVHMVLTSGGAWKSVRDRSAEVIAQLGFDIIYQRVRLAPGKAIAFGVREHEKMGHQIAFCLPGGPPSNEMAFLQLTLPALFKLSGLPTQPFPTVRARLTGPIQKQRTNPTWTNYFQAKLTKIGGEFEAAPLSQGSRLRCQALADGLVKLPKGVLRLEPGDEVEVQVFDWTWRELYR